MDGVFHKAEKRRKAEAKQGGMMEKSGRGVSGILPFWQPERTLGRLWQVKVEEEGGR